MRYTGTITKWQDARGFGFITPAEGGESVFVHISAFSRGLPRPVGGEKVTYDLTADERGRPRAQRVSYHAPAITERAPAPASGSATGAMVALLVVAGFFLFLVISVLTKRLPLGILAAYLVLSLLTFLVYGTDKDAARNNRWRTPESVLHLLDLLGGWPGGLAAQQILRHKSRKESFLVVFWIAVLLNCGALGWLFTDQGVAFLR